MQLLKKNFNYVSHSIEVFKFKSLYKKCSAMKTVLCIIRNILRKIYILGVDNNFDKQAKYFLMYKSIIHLIIHGENLPCSSRLPGPLSSYESCNKPLVSEQKMYSISAFQY